MDLRIPDVGSAMRWHWDREVVVRVEPELTVEPILTYYERRAQGYDFVRRVLDFAEPLNTTRRLTPGGPVTRSLDEELDEMTALFHGAAAIAGQELGMEAASGPQGRQFREWAKTPYVAEDIRMMTPVLRHPPTQDEGLGNPRVGQALTSNIIRDAPAAHVVKGRPRIEFDTTIRQIAYPVFARSMRRAVA